MARLEDNLDALSGAKDWGGILIVFRVAMTHEAPRRSASVLDCSGNSRVG